MLEPAGPRTMHGGRRSGGSGKGGLENFFTAATAITAPYFCVSLLGPRRPGGRGRLSLALPVAGWDGWLDVATTVVVSMPTTDRGKEGRKERDK